MENRELIDILEIKTVATVTYSESDLQDIICTAFESGQCGIGYWFCAIDVKREESDYISLTGVDADLAYDVDDIEELKAEHIEQEGELWHIDTATIKKGISELIAQSSGCDAALWLMDGRWEMIDAEAADLIVQLGLFGKVIYG